MLKSVLLSLFFLSFLAFEVHLEDIPFCHKFYHRTLDEKTDLISFIVPNTSVETGFVLKVKFVVNGNVSEKLTKAQCQSFSNLEVLIRRRRLLHNSYQGRMIWKH